jgi:hypothetical protein
MTLLPPAPAIRTASLVGAAAIALALLLGCGDESAETTCPEVPTYDVKEMPSVVLADYAWLDDDNEVAARRSEALAENADMTDEEWDAEVALWTRYRQVLIELGEAAAQGCVTYPTPPPRTN